MKRDQALLEKRERKARRRVQALKEEEKQRRARVERTLEEKGEGQEHEMAGEMADEMDGGR